MMWKTMGQICALLFVFVIAVTIMRHGLGIRGNKAFGFTMV